MKFKLLLVFSFISLSSIGNLANAQTQPKPVDYEIGAMFASNMFTKLNGSIRVLDSTLTFTFPNKTTKYIITKYSEPFNKFLLTDGIEEFILTITEQKGKMKGYEHQYLGIFEIKSKFYSVSYALNRKESTN